MEKARKFVFSSFFCLIGFLINAAVPSSGSETRKNVLIITIDTLRPDRLSCYGTLHMQTPHIDRLADEGILFSRAFANTSTTLPSHANILLGTSPLYHGVHENLNFVVKEDFLTLAEHLKTKGYNTKAYIGAYPLEPRFGLCQGFDIYDAEFPHDYNADLTTLERRAEESVDKACDGIRDAKEPWFVWVHCYDPHLPYDPPEPFLSLFAKNPYDGEVAYVDHMLGRLWDCLKQEQVYDETLIVFTGDHGESLGQHGELSHGFFAYNATLWVPLIIKVPGIESKRVDQYVSHLDIFPTICDIVGINKPLHLQGDSLVPVLEGKKLPARTIYFESMFPHYSHGWAPLMGFIQDNEKFIESPVPELYDLGKDFDEMANLADKKKLEKYRERLEKVIRDWSFAGSVRARERADPETLKRLESLGYISSSSGSEKDRYGPEDDVKNLLPIHTKNFEALALHEKGKTEEALAILQDVLQKNPKIGMTYVYLASVLSDEGRLEDSIEWLREGLSKFPGMYDIYKQYIKTLRRARAFDEIIADFNEKSFREIQVDPEIWNHVGFAYAVKEDWENAIKAFDRALSLDARYAEAFFNRGEAYLSLALQKKDPDLLEGSSENFKKSIEMDPDYAFPYFGLGKIYWEMGDMDSAIYCWQKAVELKPHFGQAIYSLGEAYLAKGDKARALHCFLYLKDHFFDQLSDELRGKIYAFIAKCKI